MYGLTGQIRRAATSIPANLAEGCGRDGDAELARYLEYHLLLAHDLKLLQSEDYMQLTERVVELKRMLTALIQKLTAERSQRFFVDCASNRLPEGPLFRGAVCEKA